MVERLNAQTISSDALDAQLRACVHCGLCLNSCPTYLLTGDEVHGPRGRLVLMANVVGKDAALDAGDFSRESIDACLGCRNCETVCPSGVSYGHLLEETRARLGPAPGQTNALLAWVLDHVLAHPRRLALAAMLGGFTRRWAAGLVPARWRSMLQALPARPATWPRRHGLAASGDPSHDQALLLGCAQWVYTPEVARATAALVTAAGGIPYAPTSQGCCGALSHHNGSVSVARERAADTVDAFAQAGCVVVPSAGCSAHLKTAVPELLANDPARSAEAQRLAGVTADVVEWLHGRRDRLRFRVGDPVRVLYHPPCHHSHAQGIRNEPLELLAMVPGVTVVQADRPELCCGSAGSYSLQRPREARAIRDAKLESMEQTRFDLLVTANPGCELFLHQGLREQGVQVPVMHLVTFLADRLDS